MFKDALGQSLKENSIVIFVPEGTSKFFRGRVHAFNLYSADIQSDDRVFEGVWFKRILKVPESTEFHRFTRNHKQNDFVFWCRGFDALKLHTITDLKGTSAVLNNGKEVSRNLLLSARVFEDYPEVLL